MILNAGKNLITVQVTSYEQDQESIICNNRNSISLNSWPIPNSLFNCNPCPTYYLNSMVCIVLSRLNSIVLTGSLLGGLPINATQ